MRVLLVGDTPAAPTGTARVIRELGLGLARLGHTVGYAGNGHDGIHRPDINGPVYPWVRGHLNSEQISNASSDQLKCAIDSFRPNAIVLFGDAFYFPYIHGLRMGYEASGRSMKWILYLTIDCAPFPVQCHSRYILDAADHIACTTMFGCDVLAGTNRSPVPSIRHHYQSEYVPLGVSQEWMDCDREALREQMVCDRPIVGWVGNNQGRKSPDTAIETLYWLHRLGVPAFMWMRTDEHGDANLGAIASHYGLRVTDDLELLGDADIWICSRLIVEDEMRNFYGRLDVLLSTASAGAPELPILEARACGTPVVAVDTSCFREVATVVAPPAGGTWGWPVIYHEMADPKALAAAVKMVLEQRPDVMPPPGWNEMVSGIDRLLHQQPATYLPGTVF